MVTEALTAPLGPWKPTLNPMITVPSIQDDENPDLDAIEHVEMVAHDPRTGREEHNDGLHLVTTHFLLSPRTLRRQKYTWYATASRSAPPPHGDPSQWCTPARFRGPSLLPIAGRAFLNRRCFGGTIFIAAAARPELAAGHRFSASVRSACWLSVRAWRPEHARAENMS